MPLTLGSVRDEPCHRCAPTGDRDLFTRPTRASSRDSWVLAWLTLTMDMPSLRRIKVTATHYPATFPELQLVFRDAPFERRRCGDPESGESGAQGVDFSFSNGYYHV